MRLGTFGVIKQVIDEIYGKTWNKGGSVSKIPLYLNFPVILFERCVFNNNTVSLPLVSFITEVAFLWLHRYFKGQ